MSGFELDLRVHVLCPDTIFLILGFKHHNLIQFGGSVVVNSPQKVDVCGVHRRNPAIFRSRRHDMNQLGGIVLNRLGNLEPRRS